MLPEISVKVSMSLLYQIDRTNRNSFVHAVVHPCLTFIVNELQCVHVLVSMKILSTYWSQGSRDLLGIYISFFGY